MWDCVVSNLALHYIENLEAIFQKVHQTLKMDGIFLFNIEHPVFTAGIGQDWIYTKEGCPQYWPVDDYFIPGERHTHFLGCDVVKQHHTLTQILMGLLHNGFELKTVEEAEPPQEMMDIPGVLNESPEVVQKIKIAKKYHLKIDGHAPLLSGEALKKYVQAGISTDHECSNLDEALEKIDAGMKILIREGSAAKNYNALKSLIASHPDSVMFCTDDAHPDEIIRNGHIDYLVRSALKDGFDLFTVLRIASLNPVKHYNLSVGTIQVGENADFIRIRNLESFEVLEAYKDGRKVYEKGENLLPVTQDTTDFSELNRFFQHKIDVSDLRKEVVSKQNLCIEVTDGEIITSKSFFDSESGSNFESDIDRDILKIVYLNRYSLDKKPQVSWIKGIGLKEGAFATSIAHDSHNILAVGCSDSDIQEVINRLIENKGGLVVKNASGLYMLELPIGGIMSDKNAWEVAERYEFLTMELKNTGCRLSSPFMTLAFMSLIVIPELKIGEKGLFDFKSFRFIEEDKE